MGFPRGLLVSNRASFEGRRDGGEGQGAGVVQIGVDGGGNVGKEGSQQIITTSAALAPSEQSSISREASFFERCQASLVSPDSHSDPSR